MVEIGEVVMANAFAAGGLPYRAKVEALKDERARIRPLSGERVLTAGSAKTERRGPSVRARWVDARWLEAIPSPAALPPAGGR